MCCDRGSLEREEARVALCVSVLNGNIQEDVRERARETLEIWDAPGCVGLTDGVLCRLEAVLRAALRLDAVSDDSHGRTRKVEPGNEPEGGRAQADRSRQRAVAPYGRLLSTRHTGRGLADVI